MNPETQNPVGRPTKYDPAFCDMARESMRIGYSKTATAGSLGVCKATFDTWCKEHSEFLGAVKEGQTLRTLKLEKDLLAAVDGPTVTSRIFALKNAAPDEWRDKQIIAGPGPDGEHLHKVSADDAFARLASRLASPATGTAGVDPKAE